ncbi:MAG: hypothetical protein JSS72_09920 [Armatimonadetes bacterium]|nr:hypothetical protein [Armatimonadota bacterium]
MEIGERDNSEGLPRDRLIAYLRDARRIAFARRAGYCLLCRRKSVNEAALCGSCYSQLTEEEFGVAQRYLSGVGP